MEEEGGGAGSWSRHGGQNGEESGWLGSAVGGEGQNSLCVEEEGEEEMHVVGGSGEEGRSGRGWKQPCERGLTLV